MPPSSPTPEQLSAIEHIRGPLLVIAGPGAGKTRVIVERCVHLISEGIAAPENILVTTFTNKATEELYDRLYIRLKDSGQKITISTIHSFCKSLLSSFPGFNPLGAHFEVLDAEEQFLIIYDNLKALGLSQYPKTRVAEFVNSVITTFNLCTEECVDPDAFIREAHTHGKDLLGLKVEDGVEEYCAVAEAYKKYRKLLFDERLVDFSLLQETAFSMVKGSPVVQHELSQRYQQVLVDEYQDTNRLQVMLFKEITRPHFNVCAVGDDDQSIYRFRGANVKSFLHFEKDFPAGKEIKLTANFRSTPVIVEATSSLIEKNVPDHKKKELVSGRECCSVTPVNLHETTAGEEAASVVDALIDWKKKGIITSWNEVAVLLRSVRSHAGPYLDELRAKKIPFVAFGQCSFFCREDITAIQDILKFCGYKTKCPVAGIRPPVFDVSAKTLKILAELGEDPASWETAGGLDKSGIAGPDLALIKRLAGLRSKTLSGEYKHHLLGLFYDILDCSGYFAELVKKSVGKKDQNSNVALANLALFSGLIATFQKRVRSSNLYKLGEYLYFIQDGVAEAQIVSPAQEAVRVMTVHQAKGLEFPVVVIGAAMKQRFPSSFRKARYPVPAYLKISKEADDETTHVRDERRLFYVGMTRAEDMLVIGSADKVKVRGGGPSPFISEIKKDAIVRSIKEIKERPKREGERNKAPQRKRLSYSGLHAYLTCPLQYMLIYECGFAVPQIYWAYFGGAIHNLLEHIHRQALGGTVIGPSDLPALWKTMWKPPESWDAERKETMGKTGLAYLSRYLENYAARLANVYWVEEPVEIPENETNILLTGRLDLACRQNGGISIIDFKIRKRTGLVHQDLQVQVYALAAVKTRGETVMDICLHLLGEKPGSEIMKYDWNESVKQAAEETIHNACRGIVQGQFNEKPGIHCRFCDFRNLCPFSSAPKKPEELEDEITFGAEAKDIG